MDLVQRLSHMHNLSAYLVFGQIYLALCRFLSVPLGFIGSPRGQIGTPSISNGISLVLSGFRIARVQVYEGRYAAFAAHLVHGGCIVCRIKDQSGNIPVSEERLDAGESVQHGRKVMAGSTLQDREDRQS